MKTRVQNWGNDLALRIPKSFADEVGLQTGSAVEVSVADGNLIISPIAKSTLRQLLAQVNDENLHRELETKPTVGNVAFSK